MDTRFFAIVIAVFGMLNLFGCTPSETPLREDTDSAGDSDSETDEDSGVAENPCAGGNENDWCMVPGMTEPVCDTEHDFVLYPQGNCDEGEDGDLYCAPQVDNCPEFEPPYCDGPNNAVRDRTYSCVDPVDGYAHCAEIANDLVQDCDDLAGTSFCGDHDEDNDTIYTSSVFNCDWGYSGASCVPFEPTFVDDCELYGQKCEDGECVEAPPCYEAGLGDDCDTGVTAHCEGNILVQQEGTCDDIDMYVGCVPEEENCAPLTCIEDTDGAHCG